MRKGQKKGLDEKGGTGSVEVRLLLKNKIPADEFIPQIPENELPDF